MIIVPQDKIGLFKQKGWWGDLTFDDLVDRHASEKPHDEALVDPPNLLVAAGIEPRRLSWSDVRREVDRRAAALYHQGLRKDEVMLVQLPNGVELTLMLLAIFKLGAIASPVPTQYRSGELTRIAQRTDAVAAVTVARLGKHDHLETMLDVQRANPGLRHVFVVGPTPVAATSFDRMVAALTIEEIAAAQAAIAGSRPTADDVTTICWTSGTEAEPKGVPRSHNEWLINGYASVAAAQLQPGTRLLNPFPMVNMAGMATGLCAWLAIGAVLVHHLPFDLPIFLQQVRDERIEYTVAPPAVLNKLLDNEELLSGIDLARLTRIGSGSAPLSDWMVQTFHDRYGVEVINIFGSNEGACFAACIADVPDAADRAICFPRYGDHGFDWSYAHADRIFTRLVDPDTGEEITRPGIPGELRVKGPTVFSGYWRSADVTARAFDKEGWFRTGDLFAITGNRNQYYNFVGRLKDIIIRGGVNISAEEIERYLLDHPDVREVAVIGYPDPQMGERLLACVVPTNGSISMEAINRYLVEDKRVAVFKQIERLEIMNALPRNPVGKLLKRELRESLFESQTP